jgi:hypothetical protein
MESPFNNYRDISAQKTQTAVRGNRFDLLYIRCPIDALVAIDRTQRKPEGLHKVSEQGPELVLKFSSKVLGAKYPELLSNDTIREALGRLQPYALLDTETVISEGRVTFLHCTEDVEVSDPRRVIPYLRSLPTPSKYYVQPWSRTSVAYVNQAETPKHKDRLAIYAKLPEIEKRPVKEVENTRFENIVRFEYQLTGKAMICNRLGIRDNSLSNVLESDTPVVANCLRRLFGERSPPPSPPTGKAMWDGLAVEGAKAMFQGEPERALAYMRSLDMDTRTYEKKLKQGWSDDQNILDELLERLR